jgi:hypothetical protein
MTILDVYVNKAPAPQNALDIFKGEWASRLPTHFASLEAGRIPLFEDRRLEWFKAEVGGVEGQTVLELGPLEAGHTYMLERCGAQAITAIESNTRAYLKCLVIKELLDLKRARFLCGDFVEYLRTNETRFDVCLASGVLYHVLNPVELIALLARTTDCLYLWTHYYDQTIISRNPQLAPRFTASASADYAGFRHTLYRQEYRSALERQDFYGGGAEYSHWLGREEILKCLDYFGFKELRINFHVPEHPNGPCLAVAARKSKVDG